jgi:hypothetical protein
MSAAVSDLKAFEPGAFITITDVMTGVRKLARVADNGTAYIDLDADDCTPLPIYATLDPVEAGNMLGWGLVLVDREPQHSIAFKALCEKLIQSGEGVIRYNRAAYWAFTHKNFNFDQAMAAANAETAKVAEGRAVMDDMIKNVGGAP